MKNYTYLTIIIFILLSFNCYADGKSLYNSLCVTCHGVTGKGDGPVGAALPPDSRPRDLTTGDMKYAKDKAKMKEVIKKGGAAVGLSPLMPAQSGLSDVDLDALVEYVMGLKK